VAKDCVESVRAGRLQSFWRKRPVLGDSSGRSHYIINGSKLLAIQQFNTRRCSPRNRGPDSFSPLCL